MSQQPVRGSAKIEESVKSLDPKSKNWNLGVNYEDTFTEITDSVTTT